MAEERLPCGCSEQIVATIRDSIICRLLAMSLSPFQKASSRLTLVLRPAMTIERLTIVELMAPLAMCTGIDQTMLRCKERRATDRGSAGGSSPKNAATVGETASSLPRSMTPCE